MFSFKACHTKGILAAVAVVLFVSLFLSFFDPQGKKPFFQDTRITECVYPNSCVWKFIIGALWADQNPTKGNMESELDLRYRTAIIWASKLEFRPSHWKWLLCLWILASSLCISKRKIAFEVVSMQMLAICFASLIEAEASCAINLKSLCT